MLINLDLNNKMFYIIIYWRIYRIKWYSSFVPHQVPALISRSNLEILNELIQKSKLITNPAY